jgi:uncharacterized repeat protein (TIGR03803 family)
MSIKHSVTKQKSILTAIGFITLLSALVFPGRLYGFVELFSFSNPPNPQAGLVQGSDGNFYGITSGLVTLNDYFGSTVVGNGSVFKLTPAGVLTTLVSFNGTNGSNPVAALIQGTDGNFYGTTSSGGAGGNGTMFQMTAAGVLTTLVSFGGMNGGGPNGLVQGTNGNFYGTTESGGTSNYGTVFQATPAGEMTTLYSFTNGTDGGGPNGLVQGNDGNFYGTTSDDYGSGTVFLMTPAGALTTLYSFGIDGTNGGSPQAGLIQGGDGNFYGTTMYSGAARVEGAFGGGTVFQLTPAGVLTTLVSFDGTNGYCPQAGLVRGSDGNFYGTTFDGGTNGDGTVFQLTPSGVLTTLLSFSGTNGANPQAGLVQGNDGNFYGTTTYSGGAHGDATPWDSVVYSGTEPPIGAASVATVFKITSAGGLTTLYSFVSTNGYDPNAGLVEGIDGNFYGTTVAGGVNGYGTVFRITPAGALTTLVSFNGANGSLPVAPLVQGSDSNFYGTTYYGGAYNDGTVFEMTPAGALVTLVSFSGTNGSYPHAPLLQGSDGNFYGTTFGFPYGYGTVFKMTPDGALTNLVSFDEFACPMAPLVQGSNGIFYGTTAYGNYAVADFSGGTVFKITPAGVLTTLISLNSFPAAEEAGLVQGTDGNFYGTTIVGGAFDNGSVFRITADGALTTLYSFTGGGDGLNPQAGLVQGTDGNFYGTTYYDSGADPGNVGGTVFKITPAGVLTTLVSFNGANGNGPQAGLVQGSDGNFYGITDSGGSRGGGTIFRIDSLKSSPPMTVALASNQVIVSWPEDYPAFTLQTTSDLNPPASWLDATDSPVVLNGQFTVTNSLSAAKFYRLRY